jgi:hypothetical protein
MGHRLVIARFSKLCAFTNLRRLAWHKRILALGLNDNLATLWITLIKTLFFAGFVLALGGPKLKSGDLNQLR